MSTQSLAVANEIYNQLGGKMFSMMTGSYNLVGGDNQLTMTLRRNKASAKWMRVTLNASDTYTVEFIASNLKEKARFEDVYCDKLRSIFEETTGMYTKL